MKKRERNDPQPNSLVSFTSLISGLYHTLTAVFISVYYRHLLMNQALLGLVFIYEIDFFRVLPLLYILLWKRLMTAGKCLFLFINYEV